MSGQEEDSNLSSKIDVFCNKYRVLMVEDFCKEETLNYLCCQFDGEGFHSFKVMAG